jgi:hypothetical protein
MPFTALEAKIRANRLLDLPVSWQDELIYPYYNGLSIYNLAQTVVGLLGAPAQSPLDNDVWAGESPFGQVNRVVVIITDGLGYRLLQQLIETDAQLRDDIATLTEGRGAVPLTSVAPSTTACAMPTFWTAQHPGTHGMLGTALLLREVATMVDMLNYTPGAARMSNTPLVLDQWGFPADKFIPVPSIAEQLGDVPLHLVIGTELYGTSLSRLMHRGVHQHYGYANNSEMFPRLTEVLTQTRGQQCYVSMYIPTVDAFAHSFGHNSQEVHLEIRRQMHELSNLVQAEAVRDRQTLVMIVADHGHRNAPTPIDLTEDLRVANAMRLPFGGDERFSYLYLRQDTGEAVKAAFAERWSDVATVVDAETAVAAGLFGEAIHPEILHRLGDQIVIVRPGARLVDQARQMRMVSLHAGLGEWEMLVPLLWKRI